MKSLFALLLVCSLAVASAQTPIPYQNCGSDSDHIHILSATADLWPPVPGQHSTITLTGNLDEPVDGGQYAISAALDGLPIIDQTGNLSDLPNITWPIQPGAINITKRFKLPSIIGSGTSIALKASATDSLGQELLCIGLTVTIPMSAEGDNVNTESVDEVAEQDILDLQAMLDAFPVPQAGEQQEEQEEEEEENTKPFFGDLMDELINIGAGDLIVGESSAVSTDVLVPVSNCGFPTDIIVIQNITSTVWPPALGTTANITANFMVTQTVTGGTYSGTLSVDNFPVMNKTGNIADLFKMPVPKGPMSITKSITLPSSLPFQGEIQIQVGAGDAAGNELFCLGLAFTV